MDSDDILDSLQGGVIKGHGRPYSAYLFLSFSDDRFSQVKAWIRNEVFRKITSARDELEDSPRSTPFLSLALSSHGCLQLELKAPRDLAFSEGMQARAKYLGDDVASHWEAAYREGTISAMLSLADDDQVRLASRLVSMREQIAMSHVAEVRAVETGSLLTRDGSVIEHFGYIDGISQPQLLIRSNDGDGQVKWTVTNGSVALVEDDYGGYGTFLVFRKIEQNVALWNSFLSEQAKLLVVSVSEVGARIMGRHQDGTPMARCRSNNNNNDFDFSQDANGERCPFSAHIRKMNSRDGVSPRIVRRGVTYGVRPDLSSPTSGIPAPTNGVGLLFVSLQSSIEHQFESIHRIAIGLGQSTSECDSLLGTVNNNQFVTAKGGGYFFLPSLECLRNL